MVAKLVVPGLYKVRLGMVNAYLVEADDGLALVDTGSPGDADAIFRAVRSIGREPADIRHIIVTHCHPDHAGSLAALKRATTAASYMHPADAAMVRTGACLRPLAPAPGIVAGMIFRLILRMAPKHIEPAEIDYEVVDGEELSIAGGLRAVHVPGHCAGQLALVWQRHGGVLFAADACANVFFGLALSPAYEDLAEGQRSLAKLAALEFEVACFGHGRPIRRRAAQRFRRRWAPRERQQAVA